MMSWRLDVSVTIAKLRRFRSSNGGGDRKRGLSGMRSWVLVGLKAGAAVMAMAMIAQGIAGPVSG